MDRRAGLSHLNSWLDLGIALTESSGATALKYFKDSPLILGLIEQPDARTAVLAMGLELADQDANVTLEYLRAAPHLLAIVPLDELRPWLEIGLELVEADVVVGLEFIRQIHHVASVLPVSEARTWISFATTLVIPNTLGKPDYMAAMEFMSKEFEIGIGLETSNDLVREKTINKGLTFHQYKKATQLLKTHKMHVKTYLLMKPPFLTEKESLDDCIQTTKDIDIYTDLVSLNPTNVQCPSYDG